MVWEILTLLAVTILFTLIFISAFLALFYALANFILGQTKKLSGDMNDLVVIISFGKVFVISLVGFSFFIYSMSFLLRIEGDIFKQQKSVRTAETEIVLKKEGSSREEGPSPPLFDFVIQAAAEQNTQKRLTSVFASGAIFSLVAIAAMAGYIAYLAKNEKHHET